MRMHHAAILTRDFDAIHRPSSAIGRTPTRGGRSSSSPRAAEDHSTPAVRRTGCSVSFNVDLTRPDRPSTPACWPGDPRPTRSLIDLSAMPDMSQTSQPS
jgi:hypothetical protein